jgi:uncharacterized Zn-binding protein involved in type VI secretion
MMVSVTIFFFFFCHVMTINGDLQPVARIGDTLDCGCMIMGGGNTVGGGANG